jgi:hypothetical protein
MASKKISAMDPATEFLAADIFPIVSGGTPANFSCTRDVFLRAQTGEQVSLFGGGSSVTVDCDTNTVTIGASFVEISSTGQTLVECINSSVNLTDNRIDVQVGGAGNVNIFCGINASITLDSAGIVIHGTSSQKLQLTHGLDVILDVTSAGAVTMLPTSGQNFTVNRVRITPPASLATLSLQDGTNWSTFGNRTIGNLGAVTVLTVTVPGVDGSYLVSGNVRVTTATSHAFNMTVSYTDETNTAQVANLSFYLLAGATTVAQIRNTNGTVPYQGVAMLIRAKAGTNIVVATSGTFTTVVYNAEARIQGVS